MKVRVAISNGRFATFYTTDEIDKKIAMGGSSTGTTDYNDLINKPSIPSAVSQLANDSNFIADVSYVHTDNNYTTTDKTKLAGIATGANNYVHPSTHSISEVSGLQTALDGKVDDSQVLTNVPAGAVFTDTIYTHPANHPPSIITQDASNRFVTDAEKTAWNGKQNALGFTPVNTTDSRLSDARTPTAHTHVKANITDFPAIPTALSQLTEDTTHRLITDSDHTLWDSKLGSKADVEGVLTGVISTHTHASGTPTAHATTHMTNGSDPVITVGTVQPTTGMWYKVV